MPGIPTNPAKTSAKPAKKRAKPAKSSRSKPSISSAGKPARKYPKLRRPGNQGKVGRPALPVDELVARGTFRPDRQGPAEISALSFRPKPVSKLRQSATAAKKFAKNEADLKAIRNGCRFNQKLVDHVVEFFQVMLRHSKGRWAGKPFKLLPWQRDELIAPLFGWVRPDGRRRFSRSYVEVPKKNGKSTIASGIGLYLMAADGEPGAEVYSVAGDKDQASIVHGEAVHMVESSPALSSCIAINRTTRNMHYTPTRSWYRVLSSKPTSSEGLNAHGLIIDELHIWRGRELWDTLGYAGRSRLNPLTFVITTAGDDVQSVCFEQYQRAKLVDSGQVEDDRLFTLIYEADEDSDWTDPKVWRDTNPSLGETLKLDDLAADCEEAKPNVSKGVAFKRYTLNIWARSAEPWLKLDDWSACFADFGADDLLGAPCYAGLDLAKTRDMTAAVLVFPLDGPVKYRVLPFFWLPQGAVDKLAGLVNELPDWIRDGFVRVTPGDVLDYDVVRQDLVDLAAKFKIEELAYDRRFADMLLQQLADQHGLDVVEFPQTITTFNDPTTELERLIGGREIQHSGDPVLAWQIGHCQVERKPMGIKPKKPRGDADHRKIDGVVALIMGLARSMQYRQVTNVYNAGKRPEGLVII